LKSIYDNQVNDNQVIVVLDGYVEESQEVVRKYKGLNVLGSEDNKGQTWAHNNGVIAAIHDKILVINDDNVVCRRFDARLEWDDDSYVIAPNQIEPEPSIFKSFLHIDYGRTPETFQYEKFLDDEDNHICPNPKQEIQKDGGTWPVFMAKKWWMILGGIDPYFPSPAVADLDFFYRCDLAGLRIKRDVGLHFYHFAGAATKATPEKAHLHQMKEQQSWAYLYYKWGAKKITRNMETNLLEIE